MSAVAHRTASARARGLALATCIASAGLFATGAVVAPAPADAYIPPASRVVGAVARHNKAVGRSKALRFEVSMRQVSGARGEPSEPIGRGVLVTHPSGLARLELRGANDLVERHVLQAGEHLATRNGEPLQRPREFLPPLYLLQTDSSLALRTGLEALGAQIDAIGLAPCGDGDCYVLGDPRRVPPAFEPPLPEEEPGDDAPDAAGGVDVAASPFGDDLPVRRLVTADPLAGDLGYAALWVDLATYEARRIDMRSGVVVWLGPTVAFDRVQAPSWYQIDEPGKPSVRFEVLGVSPVDAPAAAFSRSWLGGPVVAPADGGELPSPTSGVGP